MGLNSATPILLGGILATGLNGAVAHQTLPLRAGQTLILRARGNLLPSRPNEMLLRDGPQTARRLHPLSTASR